MTEEQAIKLLLETAVERNGKKELPCAEAFRLAGRHKIELSTIAGLCNKVGIKVTQCQLGCFK